MKPLLFHPKTELSIKQAVASKPHALLIVGERGSGKRAVSHLIAEQLLNVSSTTGHPYFQEITPENKSVTIDQIRELNRFLQLKVPGSSKVKRVAVVYCADTMTTEAQNALLKTLEEPPDDTVLLLTTDSPQSILPTIHSRVQQLVIGQPSKQATLDYFNGSNEAEIDKVYGLSNGNAGLTSALLSDSSDHELVKAIDEAKQLYRMTAYERLTIVDQISKQRDSLPNLMYALKRIANSGMQMAADKGQKPAVQAWHRRLDMIIEAEKSLHRNVNTKLLLTDLFINL